jgi:hypothetical protein
MCCFWIKRDEILQGDHVFLALDTDVHGVISSVAHVFDTVLERRKPTCFAGLGEYFSYFDVVTVNLRWPAVITTTTPPGCSCMADFSWNRSGRRRPGRARFRNPVCSGQALFSSGPEPTRSGSPDIPQLREEYSGDPCWSSALEWKRVPSNATISADRVSINQSWSPW